MLPVLPDLYAAVKSQFKVTHPLPDHCPKEEKFFFFNLPKGFGCPLFFSAFQSLQTPQITNPMVQA